MSDSQSVSVPSRGEESNNSHRFLTRSKSASSSFRPLSGRRVQQSDEKIEAVKSNKGFRPLSGQRVQQSELRTTFSGTPVMFPSPLGAKSPTIRGCSRKVQGEVMGFPSPLGVKSPTIVYRYLTQNEEFVESFRPLSGQRVQQYAHTERILLGDVEVSVPSRGEESNNTRNAVMSECIKHVSVPSRGEESNNFAFLINRRGASKFPSPLGVKSPTICHCMGARLHD